MSDPAPDGGTGVPEAWPSGSVAWVAVLGRPNVGKSTLLNTLTGYRLAAVSTKPQTTRKRWLGVVTTPDSQLVFLDTPGIHRSNDELDRVMEESVTASLEDADLILCLVDPTRPPGEEDELTCERVAAVDKPVLLVLNKCDVASREQIEGARDAYTARLGDRPCFEISALDPETVAPLTDALRRAAPTGPFLFPPDQVTDAYVRDIAAELIREAVLENCREEIPHATAVVVEAWQETDDGILISALLIVERAGQKGVLIGRGGRMLGELRTCALAKLAEITDKPVELKFWIKVMPGWRRKRRQVRELSLIDGY